MRGRLIRPPLAAGHSTRAAVILKSQFAEAAIANRPEPPMLTQDMKRVVQQHPLGYVATASADGTPNLSPKGTFFVIDDTTIAFAEIRSPATIRNLETNPRIEVNFLDVFVRKGYRFAGNASIVKRGEGNFDHLVKMSGSSLAPRIKAIVVISVMKALPLVSPAYDHGVATEASLRRTYTTRFRKMQPGEKFEE
jgi:predicted pyridoxine 5'-phosphate oxidase superfamily flavin-nucleotide-binding protein